MCNPQLFIFATTFNNLFSDSIKHVFNPFFAVCNVKQIMVTTTVIMTTHTHIKAMSEPQLPQVKSRSLEFRFRLLLKRL